MKLSWPRASTAALVLALAIAFGSCGAKDRRSAEYQPFNEEPSQAEPVQNSGRTLNGAYTIASTEDTYAAEKPANRSQVNLTFDGDGQFSREAIRDGAAARREKGSYVIGSRGEFVLYVEQVGGELLQSARVERYTLSELSQDKIILERSPGNQLVLQHK